MRNNGPEPESALHAAAGVHRDPAEPGLFGAFLPEPGEIPPGFDKGFLCRVLGQERIIKQAQTQSLDVCTVRSHQANKRLFVRDNDLGHGSSPSPVY
jgi:hypothetical protein